MKKIALAVVGIGIAGLAYAARTRRDDAAPIIDQLPSFDLFPGTDTNQDSNMQSDQAETNLNSFLEMIMVSEGTRAGGRNPYATTYAYQFTIKNFSDHPANLGWRGVPLSDKMCSNAGLGPGCVSTAAGAYQINKPTWNRLRNKIDLPDFSESNQDSAAIELIDERGALNDVYAGRFDVAVNKVRKIWASLPGAGYGQGESSLAKLQAAYAAAGGKFA